MQIFKYGALALVAIAGSFLTASAADMVTANQINQGSANYEGKTVEIIGKVDRIISPGAFIVQDPNGSGPSHRILVVTASPLTTNSVTKQQAGTAAINVSEGDRLNLTGKVDKLTSQTSSESLSPGSDEAMVESSTASMPVLVIQPNNAHRDFS